MTKKHKKRIGEANLGREPSKLAIKNSVEARKGNPAWNKGVKTGEEYLTLAGVYE